MSLKKIDLIESVYSDLGIPKKDSINIIEGLFEIMRADLADGNDVKISGFGKWMVKSKKKRMGSNPQSGGRITIDARRVVTFKASNVLRDAVNSKG
jgi:integration host factor subunit alpha